MQPSPAPPRLRGPMKGHEGRGQRRPSSLPTLNLRALHAPEVTRVHRLQRDVQRQCMRCNQAVAPLQLSSVPCATAWSAKAKRSVTAAAFARAKRETRGALCARPFARDLRKFARLLRKIATKVDTSQKTELAHPNPLSDFGFLRPRENSTDLSSKNSTDDKLSYQSSKRA